MRASWLAMICVTSGCLARAHAVRADEAQNLAEAAVKAAGGANNLPKIVRWKETYYTADPKVKGTEREAIVVFPKSWYQDGKDIAAGNADRTEKAYLVWVWTLAPLLEKDSKLALLPAAKLGGKTILGLRLTRDGQRDIDLYFHEQTHRLARIDWRTYRIDFDDWQETDGFSYPAKSYVRSSDGNLYLRTEFQRFEILRELPKELRKLSRSRRRVIVSSATISENHERVKASSVRLCLKNFLSQGVRLKLSCWSFDIGY